RDGGWRAELRWATPLGGRVVSTPVVDRLGTAFVGADEGAVYRLDAGNGAVRWFFATGNAVQSALAIGVGGRLFAGSGDRSLYAIGELRTGSDCWSEASVNSDGLSPEEVARRFQVLLAACGGPTIGACGAEVAGGVNADRYFVARELFAQQI